MEAVVTAEEDIRRGTILVAYLRKKDKLPSELELEIFANNIYHLTKFLIDIFL